MVNIIHFSWSLYIFYVFRSRFDCVTFCDPLQDFCHFTKKYPPALNSPDGETICERKCYCWIFKGLIFFSVPCAPQALFHSLTHRVVLWKQRACFSVCQRLGYFGILMRVSFQAALGLFKGAAQVSSRIESCLNLALLPRLNRDGPDRETSEQNELHRARACAQAPMCVCV